MASFYDVLYSGIRPYLMYITIAVVFIVFVLLVKFVFEKYYEKPMEERKFQDVANANTRGEDLPIYMFHVNWCPHCKTALPEWRSFKNTYHDKQIKGYNIRCIDIDCTDDNDNEVKSMLNQYKIESYPTIKMVKGGEQIEYEARITSDNLEAFVDAML